MAEVRERQGGSPAEWDEEPWEFVLYSYLHLKDLDRRRAWVERMQRLEAAELMALAFHKPERLADERSRILASAAGPQRFTNEELAERGRAMATEIMRANLVEVC